jgi:predicted aspartyl protease
LSGSGIIGRRHFTAASGSLLLSGCAGFGAPPIEVNVSGPPAEDAAHLDTGADASQRITAPVTIDGKGPYDFVVDTGANSTVITRELADELGLPDAGPANVHGVAGVEPAPTVRIEVLQAGGITVRGLRVPALPRARLGADGLLGVDVLRNRRVLIDFVARRLSISAERPLGAEASTYELKRLQTGARREFGERVVVPAKYRFGQLIIVGADVMGRRVTAFLDSGSQTTVGNGALRQMVLGGRADPLGVRYMVPVLSATGQTARGELGALPLLRIGGLSITGLTTVYSDLHVFEIWDLVKQPSLMLGMDVLSRFNAIELDYARREVSFFIPTRRRG